MAMKIKVVPRVRRQLTGLATPTDPSQPEALPWVLFSTRSYVSATTTRLTFFDSVEGDKSLSNMESAGNLPDPQFFDIQYFGFDVMIRPTVSNVASATAVATGALDDIQQLVLQGRGFWTLNMSNKRYGPFPLSFCHASGGATGFLGGWGTYTAQAHSVKEYANNGIFDGGWCIPSGSLIIPPKVGWDVTIEWPAALTLASGNSNVRFWLGGTLYRRVL